MRILACHVAEQRVVWSSREIEKRFSKIMVNYSSGSDSKCFKELDKTVSSVKYTVLF